jgi:hypothetical protein
MARKKYMGKEPTKENIEKDKKKQVEKDTKDLYPLSEGDIKMFQDAVKDAPNSTKVKQIKLIKALKKRFDKVKK